MFVRVNQMKGQYCPVFILLSVWKALLAIKKKKRERGEVVYLTLDSVLKLQLEMRGKEFSILLLICKVHQAYSETIVKQGS